MATGKKKTTTPEANQGKKQHKEQSNPQAPVIVGIGASAGGLEAILAFFDHTPDDTGAGYVIITHLDPHHSSMLPELVQKHTKMIVEQVHDDIEVQKDRVYIIPPNKIMGIFGRRLQLLQREDDLASRKPIDYFLRTLANDQGDRAICIILSGMNSDGTQGLLAIKSELGLAIVQNPNTARFASMPQSAIDTGQVDFVLAPESMAQQIIEYVHHIPSRAYFKITDEQRIPDALRNIFMQLRTITGHDFSAYKRSTLLRRIERRLTAAHVDSIEQYARYLHDNPQEGSLLFEEFLIGVTGFFRDPEAFDALKTIAFPKLLDNKPDGYQVRIWVVGCSTGEEAYSIAILLKEYMAANRREFPVQIFATDINERAVNAARAGVYPATAMGVVNQHILNRYFTKENTSYRIKREIREMLVFATHSIIKDPPFTRLDLISCRNLLIYLGAEAQDRVLPLLHFSLRTGGILYLGNSESIGKYTDLFTTIDKKWKLFEKIGVKSSAHPSINFPSERHAAQTEKSAVRKSAESDVERQIEMTLLRHFHPNCVVVDESGSIVFVYGHTGAYLEQPQGRPRSNIFDMARDGLKIPLIAAIRKAVSENKTVISENSIQQDKKVLKTRATVIPLKKSAELQGLFLVMFESFPENRTVSGKNKDLEEKNEYVKQLEKELQQTKENLQTTIEELETSNEELKSTNEEYLSTNEELQSANEELETSKEEMQSLNEELVTVNNELQSKLEELSKTIADHRNFLESLNIPTIILDRELRIRRFTNGTKELINLIDSDVGRPISHIMSNISDENLTEISKNVVAHAGRFEKEIKTTDGHSWFMRALPYKTVKDNVDGVVITFIDIHEAKALRSSLLISETGRKLAENIISTIEEPFLVLDISMKIVTANTAFFRTFHVLENETIGRNIYGLGNRQWDIPALRELLGQILPNQDTFDNFHITHDFPRIGKREFILHARRVSGQLPGDELILLSFRVL